MDNQSLHNLLDDLAKQEIPDKMNLWNNIEKRLPAAHKRPPTRQSLRFSTAILTLVIALAFVTGAYAVYQSQFVNLGDPGIVSASAEDLITPLELTQSHPDADVNLKLQWGYADGNRIAVGWEVDYSTAYLQPGILSVELLDADGNQFSYADFLRGGGGGGGGGPERASFGSTTSWDATGISADTESLELTVVFTMVGVSDSPTMLGGRGGFGGGGGGGGGSAAAPEATEEPERQVVTPHEFSFDITLPFIPAVEGASEPVTVTAGDIPITLRDIRYAPSVTLGELCIPVGYFPDYRLTLANQYTRFLSTEERPDIVDDGTTECYAMTLLGVIADEDGMLTVNFVRFTSHLTDPSDEQWEAFQTALTESGIAMKVERGDMGSLMVSSVHREGGGRGGSPEEVLILDELMAQYLYDSIPGPWVFEIPLK